MTDTELSETLLDPTAQQFLNALAAAGAPPIYKLSVPEARAVLTKAQSTPIAKLPADIEDRGIPVGSKGGVSIRVVRPHGTSAALPAVMYFHGGGWVLGDKDTHDRLIREIAVGSGAAVIFVNYTPSPEAHYPTAIEEAYAATRWVAENGTNLGIDSNRIAVAGDSVGGNMAASVAIMAKAQGGPRLCLQVLFYPVTDANFETPSYRQFAEGYFLTREAMKWFWDAYTTDLSARSQPTASPLRASLAQLRDLPPALIITAECDVLRDEGETYARKLIAAGVRVTATRHLGIIHDFVMLNALADTPATRSALAQANGALRQAFEIGQ